MQPCSSCQRKGIECGPKVPPTPDSQTNRIKKWKQFLEKAIPTLQERYESGENPEDILNSLKTPSKRSDLSSQTPSTPFSTFSPQSPPVYPQMMPNPTASPFTFYNSTNTPTPQPTPPVPGTGYYPAATTPYPLSVPAPGTFSPPLVPVPSVDPLQLLFPSNASSQYQYPSPSTSNPSQQYQY